MLHGTGVLTGEASFALAPQVTPAPPATAGADAITVPDAHLLFHGDFQRSGSSDLKIVGDDGQSFLIRDYFGHDKRPDLLSPEGASLTAAVVEALAGPLAPGQSAQAGAQTSDQPAIGRIESVTGGATIIRNGVAITANAGDVVRKGDVVQTGAGAAIAVVFSDGSAFNISANARMVLDDFVYSAGANNNSALISLVQGSFSFVAGQVAKTGDMRVDTPVATMGIRGTAVSVEISANDGQTKFSVMVEPDGTTGSYNLFNKTTGALIGTVSNSAIGWVVTPAGPLQVIAQQVQKSPAELAQELSIVQQVFTIFNQGQQNPFVPQQAPQTPNPNDRGDVNPQNSGGQGTQITTTTPGTPTPYNGNGTPTPGNIVVTVTPIGSVTNTDPVNPPPVIPTPAGPVASLPPPVTFTIINGTAGDDNGIEGNPVELVGTPGNDFVYGFAGNDVIIAGHGGGDDFYDGGEGVDTIKYLSATSGVTFDLNSSTNAQGEKVSTADSATTGDDTFVNIETIVTGEGDDVFVLNDDYNWHIDGGSGFDIIKLAAGLNLVTDNAGPDANHIEMIDLENKNSDGTDGENTITLNSEGVATINDDGVVYVRGDSADTVKLTSDFEGQPGHWERVENGRFTQTGAIDSESFDYSFAAPVTFDTYVFVNEEGATLATAYIDTDIAITVSAPNVLIEQGDGEGGQGISQSAVTIGSGEVTYDLTGWIAEGYGGHSYRYVQEYGLSWDEARSAANAMGGNLVNITSQGENDFVNALLESNYGYVTYIGGSDSANEGTFVWVDGLEAGQNISSLFTYWAPGEPNNRGNEDYLAMVTGPGPNQGGRWNDVPNNYGWQANGYLVEFSKASALISKTGTYGSVTLDTVADVMTYRLDNDDADTQALGAGQTVTDRFEVITDDNGTPVTRYVEFTIEGRNDAPVANSEAIADQEAIAGTAFSFTINEHAFSDIDAGDTLTYSAAMLVDGGFPEDLPGWLNFDAATRTFSGTPPAEGFQSIFFLRVTATDSHDASVSETFTLEIEQPDEPNAAPVANDDNAETQAEGGSSGSIYYFKDLAASGAELHRVFPDGFDQTIATIPLLLDGPTKVPHFSNDAFYYTVPGTGGTTQLIRLDTGGQATQLISSQGGFAIERAFDFGDRTLIRTSENGSVGGIYQVDSDGSLSRLSNDATQKFDLLKPVEVGGVVYFLDYDVSEGGRYFICTLSEDGQFARTAASFMNIETGPATHQPLVADGVIYYRESGLGRFDTETQTFTSGFLPAASSEWFAFNGHVYVGSDSHLSRIESDGSVVPVGSASFGRIDFPLVTGDSAYFLSSVSNGMPVLWRFDDEGSPTLTSINLNVQIQASGSYNVPPVRVFEGAFYFVTQLGADPENPQAPGEGAQVYRLNTDGTLHQITDTGPDGIGTIVAWFEHGGELYFRTAGSSSTSPGIFRIGEDSVQQVSSEEQYDFRNYLFPAPAGEGAHVNFVREDGPLYVSADVGVLANDTDADTPGSSLTAILVDGPAHGTAFTLNADGSYLYTPEANFNGFDSFTYRVFDGTAYSDIATVTIDVAPVNDAPTGTVTITGMRAEDQTLTANVSAIADIDGVGEFSYQWQRRVSGQFVNIDGATHATYTTDDDDVGTGRSVRVVVSYVDGDGHQEQLTSAIAVITNVNDPAIIGGDLTGSVTEDSGVNEAGALVAQGQLTVSDIDGPAQNQFAYGGPTIGNYGSFHFDSSNGQWTYTANNSNAAIQNLNAGETLMETFTVASVDGTSANVTVTINGADEPSPELPAPPLVTLTVQAGAVYSPSLLYGWLIGAESESASNGGTTYSFLNDAANVRIDLIGTGLDGEGGNIQDIRVYSTYQDNDILMVSATGFDLDFSALDAAIDASESVESPALDAIFQAYRYDATGASQNDVLTGGRFNDMLRGGTGLDNLIGNGGNDTLTGGSDHDFFVFTPNSGNSTITDFQVGPFLGSGEFLNPHSDSIVLSSFGFDDISDLRIDYSGLTGDETAVITLSEQQTITLTHLNEHLTSQSFIIPS